MEQREAENDMPATTEPATSAYIIGGINMLSIAQNLAICFAFKSGKQGQIRVLQRLELTKSAPAASAKSASAPRAKTATRVFLPVPLGRTARPRTICCSMMNDAAQIRVKVHVKRNTSSKGLMVIA